MSNPTSTWLNQDNYLSKEFFFPDFDSAVFFTSQIAKIANKLDHHPTLEVSWGKVVVKTTTHDQGNVITQKDYDLCQAIDAKAKNYIPDLQAPKTFAELKALMQKADFMLGVQKRLPVDNELFYGISGTAQRLALIQTLKNILSRQPVYWNLNQFPYTFFIKDLPNVQHWVLWSRKGLSDDEVIAEIEKRFPGRNYCFFESKDKSVPEVNHAQVFIEF